MRTHRLAVLACAVLLPANAAAFPVDPDLSFTGDARCDWLTLTAGLPEELGKAGVFPGGEEIEFASTNTSLGTCGIAGGGPDDWEVTITNLTEDIFLLLFFIATVRA